eukprot:1187545-Prorocentrum_minimum.AAC.10
MLPSLMLVLPYTSSYVGCVHGLDQAAQDSGRHAGVGQLGEGAERVLQKRRAPPPHVRRARQAGGAVRVVHQLPVLTRQPLVHELCQLFFGHMLLVTFSWSH